MASVGTKHSVVCEHPGCLSELTIPTDRAGDRERTLAWVDGTSGWRVIEGRAFCHQHPSSN
jgi:hypothetical protein